MQMNLPNEIKIIRQKAFLTQEAFAKELQVAYTTVNRWESGKSRPSISAMKQIKQFCELHSIPFDDLQNAWIKEG